MKVILLWQDYMSSNFKFFIIIIILIFLHSCLNTLETPDRIELSETIFLMKGPKNQKGCTQYFPSSKDGGPTINVIYYYNKDKKVTNTLDAKKCL